MKLKVPKSTLDKALKAVCRAVPSKGIQPILNNILLINAGDYLKLNATDLDFFIEATVPSENMDEGTITLSAKKLEEIVGKLEEDDVVLEANTGTNEAKLSCRKANFDLVGISAEDFPKMEKPKANDYFTIDATLFSKIIDLVSFAASRYDVNNILGGVYMSVLEGVLNIAATDGNRLSCYEVALENYSDSINQREVVVPVKVIVEVQKIIESSVGESLDIAFLGNQIVFKTEDRFIISRLLEGVYPKYKQLIPAESDKMAQVDRKSLLSSLERVAVMANERTNLVKMSFSESGLAIESSNMDFGGAEDKLEAEFMGDDIEIHFNVKYLVEALRNINSDNIQIAMTKPLSPAVIKPISEDKYIYLIMPIKAKS